MRISDWSSDVCSSDLPQDDPSHSWKRIRPCVLSASKSGAIWPSWIDMRESPLRPYDGTSRAAGPASVAWGHCRDAWGCVCRSEEHTSELQSLMRISYAVFCLQKKKIPLNKQHETRFPE